MATEPDSDEAGARRREEARESEAEVAAALAAYEAAARFRRRAGHALRALDLTFAEWRVLEATCRLVRERGDACSHFDVARDLALDEASVGRVMRVLARRGLVSHDVDCLGINYRVYPSAEASRLVANAYDLVAGATNPKSLTYATSEAHRIRRRRVA